MDEQLYCNKTTHTISFNLKKEVYTKFMNVDKKFLSGKSFPSLKQCYIIGNSEKEQENLIKNNVLAQKFERF